MIQVLLQKGIWLYAQLNSTTMMQCMQFYIRVSNRGKLIISLKKYNSICIYNIHYKCNLLKNVDVINYYYYYSAYYLQDFLLNCLSVCLSVYLKLSVFHNLYAGLNKNTYSLVLWNYQKQEVSSLSLSLS